jgi:hypothetical protein
VSSSSAAPAFTGSAIERAVTCPASVALPRVDWTSVYSEAGTSLHGFLESIARGRAEGLDLEAARQAALELELDEERREALDQVDVGALVGYLELTPELALAFDFRAGEARVLGSGLQRRYEVTADEVPITIDVAGVDLEVRRGVIADYKRGWSKRADPRRNHQLMFAALCLARAFDLVEVEVHLVALRSESSDPFVLRHLVTLADLDAYAIDLAETWHRVLDNRAAIELGKAPPHVRSGAHCTSCPARFHCPAHTALVRQALAIDTYDEHLRIRPMSPEMVARAWLAVQGAKVMLQAIESACYAAAKHAPVYLGELGGRHRWLGELEREGNEQLDGDVVFDQIQRFFIDTMKMTPADAAEVSARAIKVTATKQDAEEAVKAKMPRGQKDRAWKAILEGVRAAGGTKRKAKRDVVEYTTATRVPTDDPKPR